ncbi:hypothetical protein AB0F52_26260 [Amycolatopsis sp. NPDC024027]|uniref:hypothetical protein n=1 Tax=Amycolatopsis sp. NPDC024027 TaxID=3154327 RepID=UPI0033C583CE
MREANIAGGSTGAAARRSTGTTNPMRTIAAVARAGVPGDVQPHRGPKEVIRTSAVAAPANSSAPA